MMLTLLIWVLAGEELLPLPQKPFAPERYVCYRTEEPIKLDGKLDESAWKYAPTTANFDDIRGRPFPKPKWQTTASLLWDDHYLYVGARLEEPHVWAKLKKRDSIIFYDNDFEVFIDPDGDSHEYYELEVNAFATEWDLFLVRPYRDGGPALHDWDMPGLKTAVHVDGTINDPSDTDKGWSVEIAIPWEVLKVCAHKPVPPEEGDIWRMNFSRVEWQVEVVNGKYRKKRDSITGKPFPEDNWVWSPQGLVNMHYPELWGFVQFSKANPAKGRVAFKPPVEEQARWQLYQLYYRQRHHHHKSGRFSGEKGILGKHVVEGYDWPPKLEASTHHFHASLRSKDGSHLLTIDHEGRLLRQDL